MVIPRPSICFCLAWVITTAICAADASGQGRVIAPGGKTDNTNTQQQQAREREAEQRQQRERDAQRERETQNKREAEQRQQRDREAQSQREAAQRQNQLRIEQERQNWLEQQKQNQAGQQGNQAGQQGNAQSGRPNMQSPPNPNDSRWPKQESQGPKVRVIERPPPKNPSGDSPQILPEDQRSLEDQRQDSRLERLRRDQERLREQNELLREQLFLDELRRGQSGGGLNPIRPIPGQPIPVQPFGALPGGRAPPRKAPRAPNSPDAAGNFAITISGLHVTKQTADDPSDGPGDEVFVCCAVGMYDATQDSFALLPAQKTALIRGLRSNAPARADAAAGGLPLGLLSSVELASHEHVLVIVPTIWEQDGAAIDEGSLTDRAGRLYELISSFESEIGNRLRVMKPSDRFGVKHGRNLGFPFVTGSQGGNRPIGMKHTLKGNEFYPEVLLLDLKLAAKLAEQGGETIHYLDDPATKLGGDYRLQIGVSRVN